MENKPANHKISLAHQRCHFFYWNHLCPWLWWRLQLCSDDTANQMVAAVRKRWWRKKIPKHIRCVTKNTKRQSVKSNLNARLKTVFHVFKSRGWKQVAPRFFFVCVLYWKVNVSKNVSFSSCLADTAFMSLPVLPSCFPLLQRLHVLYTFKKKKRELPFWFYLAHHPVFIYPGKNVLLGLKMYPGRAVSWHLKACITKKRTKRERNARTHTSWPNLQSGLDQLQPSTRVFLCSFIVDLKSPWVISSFLSLCERHFKVSIRPFLPSFSA